MNIRLSYLLFVVALGLCGYSLSAASPAKPKRDRTPPARVHFSGNLEGELEPCG